MSAYIYRIESSELQEGRSGELIGPFADIKAAETFLAAGEEGMFMPTDGGYVDVRIIADILCDYTPDAYRASRRYEFVPPHAALERIRAAGAAAADKASLDPNYLIDKAIEDMEERL